MDVGRCASVLGVLNVRVLHQIVFLVNDRPFPSDEHNGVFVIQKAHFIGGHKVAACLLEALRERSVASLALATGLGVNSFLAELFGNVLVRALLIAAEIDKGIGVADDTLPVVFEQGFELGNILQDDRGHDVAGTHGRLQAGITVWQGDVGKLVKHEAYRHGKAAHVYLVRLVVQLLKCLGVEHTHKEIEAHVVAVRDDAEDSLFAFSQLGKLQIVLVGNVLDLPQRERGQTDGGRHKDAFCRLACC